MKPMDDPLIFFDNEALLPCPLSMEEITLIIKCAILPEYANREISAVCLSPEEIQTLNRDYRHKDKPTNVLSFPYESFEAFEQIEELNTLKPPLGDILLCPAIIEQEALEQDKSFRDHFTHLLIHGTLHLQGFDHETPEDAARMEPLEIQLLQSLNIPNPYESRGAL